MASIDEVVKRMQLRDLREQLRSRNCNPGGGIEELRARLIESYNSGPPPAAREEQPCLPPPSPSFARNPPGGASQISFGSSPVGPAGPLQSDGTDSYMPAIVAGAMPLYGAGRAPAAAPYGVDPSGRASPGNRNAGRGKSSVEVKPSQVNNYARPGGNQNLGNKITGRPTSKVLAPPGGKSQISLAWD